MRKTVLTVAAILAVSAAAGIFGAQALQSLTHDEPRLQISVTIPADVPEKPGVPYLIVKKGDKVPNIEPPMELHVANVTKVECDEMGGTFQARNSMCLDVDY